MKNTHLRIFALLSLGAVSFSSHKQTFTAYIIQGDNKFEVSNNEIQLAKKPFKIQLVLNNIEGVSVNISFDRTYYDPAADNKIYDVANLAPNTMAEDSFNVEKELLVSRNYPCYWYYNPNEHLHRMDTDIAVNGRQVIANKTVEKIFDTDASEEYPIEKITKDLYLVFVSTKKDKYPAVPKVIDVTRIKINWVGN